MNIISCYKLLLILITQGIHVAELVKRINELSSIDACKGKDVDLLWKVDEEENKISGLEWYFNNKRICTSSPVEAFTVEPPYQDRIERIGKTEIRLKNVSIDDEGIYILFPLNPWSASQNMQKIFCRILEPPTNKCTCKMGHQPDFTFEQTESYCGRPRVSLVWKRKQTFEVLGDGNHILNSTLQDKEVLCCQDGEAMKCVDKNEQHCTTVSIPHQDNERPSEDGNTQHTDSVTMSGTGTGSTNSNHMQPFVLATVSLLTALVLTALVVLALLIRNRKKRKNNTDVVELELAQLVGVPQPVQVTSHRDSPDSTSYQLMWDKPDDGGSLLIKYIIRYCEVEIIPDRTEYELSKYLKPFEFVDNILASAVSYELSSLTPGRYYLVEIQAIYTKGQTLKSFIFRTKEGVPQSVQVTSHRDSPDSTSYRLMWDRPDDGGSPLIKYIILYCQVEIIPDRTEYELSKYLKPFEFVDNIQPSAVSYELSPLTPGRYYLVEIQAIYAKRQILKSFIFKTKEEPASTPKLL